MRVPMGRRRCRAAGVRIYFLRTCNGQNRRCVHFGAWCMVQNYGRERHTWVVPGGKNEKRVSHGRNCIAGCKAKDHEESPLVEAGQPALPGANREHVGDRS